MNSARRERVEGYRAIRRRSLVDRRRFEELVLRALHDLPTAFRERIENVAIVIEDWPAPGLASRHGADEASGLLGLYEGTPYGLRAEYHLRPPDRITIYRGPILAQCQTPAEVEREVRDTLLHEIGHYFGLGEQDLR